GHSHLLEAWPGHRKHALRDRQGRFERATAADPFPMHEARPQFADGSGFCFQLRDEARVRQRQKRRTAGQDIPVFACRTQGWGGGYVHSETAMKVGTYLQRRHLMLRSMVVAGLVGMLILAVQAESGEKGDALRYGWKAGQRYLYSVRIEAKLESGTV